MANQEQVDRLKKNVAQWKVWRHYNPSIQIDLSYTDLSHLDLGHLDLNHADLSYTNLSHAILNYTDLSYTNLSYADLSNTDLIAAHFADTNFSEANLWSASIIDTNLGNVDLSGVSLSYANLSHSRLNNTNLSRAKLYNANLNSAILDGTLLYETKFDRTNFGNIDLRAVQGLETSIHRGPSTIGIDTIVRSQGDIPEVFLKGAGIPDTVITYARSLVQHPIEYYTCFISYSSKNEAFAKRLHADLQSHNVRCWFAPHDMRIGDEIRSRIDESIRVHDKLLLVLSQHSIESAWVKKEVETAFEKEQQHGKLVLFPVKLDNTVMQTEKAWAADIRRMRHIGDFQRWKDHDEYEQSFTRLLRDLKAESNG